jgi:hypothetical protein
MFYGMNAKVVELPQETMRSVGPVFGTALGAVFHTDCLNLFANLNDESIDTVFADPPFNLGKAYGRGKDKDERVDRRGNSGGKAWGRDFHLQSAPVGVALGRASRIQAHDLQTLDRCFDEGYVSSGQETQSGALCAVIFHQGYP